MDSAQGPRPGRPLPRHTLLAIIWTCFSAAFLFMTLRTVIRLRPSNLARRFTFEDAWLLFSLAALLAFCILETIQLPSLYYISTVIDGQLTLSPDLVTQTERYLLFQFPIVILFWTVLWSVKAGFLALYFKLFKQLKAYRRVWYVLAAFTFLAYMGCVLTLGLSCGDVSNFFKFGGCATENDIIKSNLSVYYSTAIDIFTDLCIMAMPLRLIYGAKITPKQKIGLACVFGLGFVMIAFAVIRANQILQQKYFVNLTLLIVWSTLAASISVIVGSLPALKIFFTGRAGKNSRNSPGSGSNRKFGSIESQGKDGMSLRSLPRDKELGSRRGPDPGDSQENILRPQGTRFVVIKHDVRKKQAIADRYHSTVWV
ncbi:hypothetical protein F5X68DRAFT_247450 [Plectosphaerella plurivora]|uniref:Rhodopsin domain-containing protein n=1 Tax=Plectosphaerella plurivora TaxID=936078 RepID=A0A9P8V4D2_9PEZI|nr:hypothetical protein F5X68DRAFT_247450 [Plectosphaerella plurivora]